LIDSCRETAKATVMKSTAAKFQFDFTSSVVVEFDSISADKFEDFEFI
jgi:hypothetical protein